MNNIINITRAAPLTTVQDGGRRGHFADGISASGPMDANAFARARALAGTTAQAGLEFTMAGLEFTYSGAQMPAGFSGGVFTLRINGEPRDWDSAHALADGDTVAITPGPAGNYGYVHFADDIGVPPLLNSRATNLIVGLGGLEGRTLKAGDKLTLLPCEPLEERSAPPATTVSAEPIRFVWGIHADHFEPEVRSAFLTEEFIISTKLDRMGVRMTDTAGVFANARILSLVSDAIVPGDIQILGDGTPIVLMRDHQPTGGYPRIGSVIGTDLDRFAQLRPHTAVRFAPVTVEKAQSLLRRRGHVG